ncbi:MviM Predicted dehydrogenases and related proteins [Acidimicrobiia bacterium]
MSSPARITLASNLSAQELAGLGLEAGDILPIGEWFVRPDAARPEAARLRRETPVVGAFETLVVTDPSLATVVATTSIHFTDVPSIVECQSSSGRVLVCAIAPERLATAPEIGRYLERLAAGGSAPTNTIGVGIVGYGPFGGMGYTHGLAATETDGLAFVGVCDSSDERREAAMVDFPTVQGHVDLASLSKADDVDVVIVATPPLFHAPIALELLRAGKHVVVEKPMCLTVADAEELLAVSAEVGKTITVHQNRRWDGDFLALRRAIDTGLLGDVFNMETFVGSFEHPCRWWHSDETFSGGAVYDWGSHHIDWILRIFGSRPQRVRAISHKRVWRDVTNADQIDVHMRWDDGREARFIQSDVAGIRKPKFYVQGTSGTAAAEYAPVTIDQLVDGRGHVADDWHHAEVATDLRLSRYEPGYGTVDMVLPPVARVGWPFHRALADHLLLGEPVPVPPEESRDVVSVLEAAHASGADGGVELTCE